MKLANVIPITILVLLGLAAAVNGQNPAHDETIVIQDPMSSWYQRSLTDVLKELEVDAV